MAENEAQIEELRAACGPADRELIAKLAHVINNPNHSLLLNTALLRNVWRDLEPVAESHAQSEAEFRLAGVPWEEMRTVIPKLLEESLECVRRIRDLVAVLQAEAEISSSSENGTTSRPGPGEMSSRERSRGG